MLSLWYSKKCTRQTKFIITIFVCATILLLQSVVELSPLWVTISVAVGLAMHFYITHHEKMKLSEHLVWLPVIATMFSFFYLNTHTSLFLLGQIVLFCFLGFSLASIYMNRQPRNPS